jgi:hypothetical protein
LRTEGKKTEGEVRAGTAFRDPGIIGA